MSDLDVRVERLRPMRVAWVRAFGRSPEADAWRILSGWAKPAGLLDDPALHPVFGFNNPSPAPGAPEYGYEFWIAVDADARPAAGIAVKEFEGGLYAVTSCPLGPDMAQRWKALLRWVHTSPHAWKRSAHELERILNPLAPPEATVVELLLPLDEQE